MNVVFDKKKLWLIQNAARLGDIDHKKFLWFHASKILTSESFFKYKILFIFNLKIVIQYWLVSTYGLPKV